MVMHLRRYCEGLIQDTRYAVRSLRRSPGFTATVVLILALAIGANTAIFSLLDRLLLRDLPYPDSNKLALVYEDFGSPRSSVAPANWLDWQRMNTSFELLAASNVISETLTENGDPELVTGQLVSAEFFPTLKVQPTIGRVFTMDDDRPKSPPVVILSDRLWKRRFGGDPGIIGKTVEFDAVPKKIIGVMPDGFYFMNPGVEYWSPYAIDRARDWHQSPARTIPIIVGRLKPGVTLRAAQTEMKALAKQLEQIYPIDKNASVTVASLRDILTDDVRGSVIVLFAAVTLLLVIACINVAGMMLARASSRRREIAVRASLGAPRTALVRQLLVESLLLSLAAGGAGFLMALWGVSALVQLTPRNLIRIADVSVDGWILLYTIGVCALTGVTFGLAPAIAATRGWALRDYLHSFGRSVSASTGTRQVLVVAQVILTVILLCGAGLLARSLRALHSVPLGVESSQVLTMQITMPAARYDRDQQVEFVTRVLERLEQFPGVRSAGATRSLPVIGPTAGTPIEFKDAPEVSSMALPAARIRMATPGYFKTVGVRVVAGREFVKDDQRPNAEIVFIVNEAFVKAYLRGKNPFDSSMRVYMTREKPYGRIIGVTADVLEGSLRGSPTPTVFYNQRQLPYGQMTLYVRTTNPTALSSQAVEAINQLDPNMAVTQVRPLDEAFWLSIARDRLNAIVSASFAITALLLASIGLYGLLAFIVAERTREIGIRMALGAEATTVLRMVMNRGFCLVGLGLALGLIAAFGISRFLEGLLFGVQPNDPATFVGVPLLLLIVTTLAALVPANRATRVDPVVALRQE
jgi:putative ABC transport system permease protein